MNQRPTLRPTLAVALCALAPWLALAADSKSDSRGQAVQGVLGAEAVLPTYRALLIGVNDYAHWPNLKEARQDTDELATLLRDHYGFGDIRRLTDRQATRENIIKHLYRLGDELTERDALLIYYAGHGYYNERLKRGYWVPTDARRVDDGQPAISDWVDNGTVTDLVRGMKARHVLVVVDSCFSGALLLRSETPPAARPGGWVARALAQPSRYCLTSGALETVRDDSLFAKKFRQALQYPAENMFAVEEVFTRINREVESFSGRKPLFGRLNDQGGALEGEFVFVRRSQTAVGPLPSAPSVGPVDAPVVLQKQKDAWAEYSAQMRSVISEGVLRKDEADVLAALALECTSVTQSRRGQLGDELIVVIARYRLASNPKQPGKKGWSQSYTSAASFNPKLFQGVMSPDTIERVIQDLKENLLADKETFTKLQQSVTP